MTAEEALVSAMTMHSVGRIDAAATIYEHLLKVEPGCAEFLGMLGLARHHQGKAEEAVSLLLRAIELAPTDGSHRFNLGIVYRALGRSEDAIQSFTRALELDPKMRAASENLGDLLSEVGDWKGASASYSMAIARGADSDETLSAFARCLEKLDRKREAYAIYYRIIDNRKKQDIAIDRGRLAKNPNLAMVHDDIHSHSVLPRTGRDLELRMD